MFGLDDTPRNNAIIDLVIAAYHEGAEQRFANNTVAAMVDKGWILFPQAALQRIVAVEGRLDNIELLLVALATYVGMPLPPAFHHNIYLVFNLHRRIVFCLFELYTSL